MGNYFDEKLSAFLMNVSELDMMEEKEDSLTIVKLSDEQEDVAQDVLFTRKSKSIIAKAGSGKTEFALQLLQRWHNQYKTRGLYLTYNAKLKDEAREKITIRDMDGFCEATNYHSAALKFFVPEKRDMPNDSWIHDALNKSAVVPMDFSLVIIDEAQDQSPLYYQFICHILKNCAAQNKERPVLVQVGDPFQRIFGFNGASSEYLMDPDKYFNHLVYNDSPHQSASFTYSHFTICWRITHEMAAWINEFLNPNHLCFVSDQLWWKANEDKIRSWWGNGIRANPNRPASPGSMVYMKFNSNWKSKQLLQAIEQEYQTFGNSNVALIAQSLKSVKSHSRTIVDELGRNNHENWIIMTSDEEKQALTKEQKVNKRVAWTAHKVKGAEFDCCIVIGIDSFVEKRGGIPLDAFNLFYVMATRAKKKLIIIPSNALEYVTIRKSINQRMTFRDKPSCSILDVLNYTPFVPELDGSETNFINIKKIEFPTALPRCELSLKESTIPGRQKGTSEDVSILYRTAVELALEYLIKGSIQEVPTDLAKDDDLKEWLLYIHQEFKMYPIAKILEDKSLKFRAEIWVDLVKYACAIKTIESGFTSYWRQITSYRDWVPEKFLSVTVENVIHLLYQLLVTHHQAPPDANLTQKINLLKNNCKFQNVVDANCNYGWWNEHYKSVISGRFDILLSNDLLVELRVTPAFSKNYALQAQLYASLSNLQSDHKLVPYVVVANLAEVYTIELPRNQDQKRNDFEFFYRALYRKVKGSVPPTVDLLEEYQQWINPYRNLVGGYFTGKGNFQLTKPEKLQKKSPKIIESKKRKSNFDIFLKQGFPGRR